MATTTTATAAVASGESDLLGKIRERVDFFFGDTNFRRDKFLREKAETGIERFVSISVLMTFNTLKALTSDASIVAKAVKDSNVVEVNEAGDSIRRKNPKLPAGSLNDLRVFAGEFPPDTHWKEVRQAFQKFGKVTFVQLRRDKTTKRFLGSAFVNFESKEAMERAIKETVTFKDKKLERVMSISDWLEARKKGAAGDGRRHDGGHSDRKRATPAVVIDETQFVLKLTMPERLDFRALKNSLRTAAEKHSKQNVRAAFVDFQDDDTALVRFSCNNEDGAEFLKVIETEKIVVDGHTLDASLPSKSEIEQYWSRCRASMARSASGGGGGRKRKQYRSTAVDDAASSKTSEPTTTQGTANDEKKDEDVRQSKKARVEEEASKVEEKPSEEEPKTEGK